MQEEEFVEKWSKRLSDPVAVEELPEFLNEMLKDSNDYGSIARALGYGAVVTARAMDRAPQGGITGFQAGFVMWTFIREYMYSDNKSGLRVVDYDELLYPQREDYFSNTISANSWKLLQEEAKSRLSSRGSAHPDVEAHWQSIVEGVLPFGFVVED